jgi:hypothetical protein
MKALSIFSKMQAISLMLASAIAFGVYRFGGHAMTKLA